MASKKQKVKKKDNGVYGMEPDRQKVIFEDGTDNQATMPIRGFKTNEEKLSTVVIGDISIQAPTSLKHLSRTAINLLRDKDVKSYLGSESYQKKKIFGGSGGSGDMFT